MATISRTQLSTYLATSEQLEDWELVKSHLADGGKDAQVLRELIRNKATDIRHGSTRRQGIDAIKSEQARHSQLLALICEKLDIGMVAQPGINDCECGAEVNSEGFEK